MEVTARQADMDTMGPMPHVGRQDRTVAPAETEATEAVGQAVQAAAMEDGLLHAWIS